MSALLFTNNVTNVTLNANAQIPLGSTTHRKGTAAQLENNEIVIRMGCSHYATLKGVVNLAPTAEGEVPVNVLVDGSVAETITVTAAAGGDYVAVPFVIVVKGNCCGMRRVTLTVGAASTLVAVPIETSVE